MNTSTLACFSLACCALAGCAAKSSPSIPTAPAFVAAASIDVSSALRPAVDTNGSEWPELRRDDRRTGNNPYQTTITTANVATLKPKWTKATVGTFASPVVVKGLVYQADLAGNVYAWKIGTGAQVFDFKSTGSFVGTPYYYRNALYVGAKGVNASGIPAKVYSVNAKTSVQNWVYADATGAQLSSSALVSGGLVYDGEDAHDENANQCDANRQLVAINATSGALVSALNLSPTGLTGADIWASPMLDPSGNMYVATGNECATTIVPFPDANAVVRVKRTKPTMGVTWATQSVDGPGLDADFGATPLYVNGMVVEPGKDGYTYALDPATGATIWRTQTGAAIGSPATDGTRVYIPTLQLQPSCVPGTACGAFVALNLSNGSLAWSIPVIQGNFGFSELASPAVSNGMVFAAFNGSIWALNSATGATLWSYPTPNTTVFSGITVVNGGVLVGSYASPGTFYCFTPNGK